MKEQRALEELYRQGRPEYLDKNLFWCHVVHHKFHMAWHGIQHLSHGKASYLMFKLDTSHISLKHYS
jgi:hypothetical protein